MLRQTASNKQKTKCKHPIASITDVDAASCLSPCQITPKEQPCDSCAREIKNRQHQSILIKAVFIVLADIRGKTLLCVPDLLKPNNWSPISVKGTRPLRVNHLDEAELHVNVDPLSPKHQQRLWCNVDFCIALPKHPPPRDFLCSKWCNNTLFQCN